MLINGTSIGTYNDANAVTNRVVPFSGTLNSLQISGGASTDYFYGISVDGILLIDADIQDTVVDTPIKNYAVLDSTRTGSTAAAKLINGSLIFDTDGTGSEYPASYATQGMASSSGKYYWETTFTKGSNYLIGIGNSSASSDIFIGSDSNSLGYYTALDGSGKLYPGATNYGEAYGVGDVIGTTFDSDAGVITWYKNGVSQGPINVLGGQTMYPGVSKGSDSLVGIQINFGQQPFAASNVTHDLAAGTVEIASSIPNTSQVWSNGTKTGSVTDWSEAFTSAGDTDEDSRVLSGDGSAGTSTLEFTGLGNAQSVRVFGLRQVEETEILINGTTNADVTVDPSGSNSWSSPINVSGTGLNSISLTGYGSYNAILNAVEVDGQLLVDNDPTQDSSQVWSSNLVTNLGSFQSGYPPAHAFDGDKNKFASAAWGDDFDNPLMTFSPSEEITVASSLVIYYNNAAQYDSAVKWEINGNVVTPVITVDDDPRKRADFTFTGNIQTIKLELDTTVTGSGGIGFYAVEVDGKILVDPQGFAGGTFQTLYQEFEDWQAGGAYFYDENNQEVVRATHLRHRYGRDTADSRLGIYDLTEQPSHQVIGYEKVGDKYRALRDYTPEVRVAQAETVAAQAETAAAEAQADLYLGYLRKAACMWVVDRIYEAGEVVEFNGKLYRALINAVATTDTDPGDETDRWEDLGISAEAPEPEATPEPTPEPTPDPGPSPSSGY